MNKSFQLPEAEKKEVKHPIYQVPEKRNIKLCECAGQSHLCLEKGSTQTSCQIESCGEIIKCRLASISYSNFVDLVNSSSVCRCS